MPTWLIPIIVNLAIKLGVPALVKWLPWIPQAVLDAITELLNNLKDPSVSNSAAKKTAMVNVREAIKADATGVAPKTKSI